MKIRWENWSIARLLQRIFDPGARFAEDLQNSSGYRDLCSAETRHDYKFADVNRDILGLSNRLSTLNDRVDEVAAQQRYRPPPQPAPSPNNDGKFRHIDAELNALRFELSKLGLRVSAVERQQTPLDNADIRARIESEVNSVRREFFGLMEQITADLSAVKGAAADEARDAAAEAINEALQSPQARALALTGVANLSKRFSQNLERK